MSEDRDRAIIAAQDRVIEAAKILRRWWKPKGETMDERALEFDRALDQLAAVKGAEWKS